MTIKLIVTKIYINYFIIQVVRWITVAQPILSWLRSPYYVGCAAHTKLVAQPILYWLRSPY